MATENKIRFSIGSAFSGEGFKAARAEVAELNKGARQGAQMMGQLSSVLGGLDSSAAKATVAMTGMLQSIMTLNATAIITQGAMLAMNAAVSEMKNSMEAAKDRADTLKSSIEAAFGRNLSANVDGAAKEVREISGEFERIVAQANAVTAAFNGLKSSVATGGVVQLEVEKVNAMLAAHTEEERKTVEATYNLRLAREKAAVVEEASADKIAAAHQAVVDAEGRVANIGEQIAAIQERRRTIEEALAQQRESNGSKIRELRDALAKLQEQENGLLSKQNAERDRIEVLLVKEEQALQDAANATGQATAAVKQAELAQQRQAEAAEAARYAAESKAKADELAAAVSRQEAAEAQAAAALRKDAADAQKESADAAAALAKAERDLAKALSDYERNYAQNRMEESIFGQAGTGKTKKSMITPVRVEGAIKAEVVAKDLEDAINNGLVRSVKDMDRFQRNRAKEVEKMERDRLKTLEKEAQRYKQLTESNRKTWSKADREFAEKFEKIKAAAEARKKEIDDARQRVAEERRRAEKNAKNLEEINKKLNNLGLK